MKPVVQPSSLHPHFALLLSPSPGSTGMSALASSTGTPRRARRAVPSWASSVPLPDSSSVGPDLPSSATGGATRLWSILLLLFVTVVAPGQAEIFVGDHNNGVLVFADDANGDVAPLRTLPVPAAALAIDTVNGEIFLAGGSGIGVYPIDFDAGTPPIRFLPRGGTQTTLEAMETLIVDPIHDELYVLSTHIPPVQPAPWVTAILVFPRTADGDVAPLRVLEPSPSAHIEGAFLDLHRDELYVPVGEEVRVYPRTAEGAEPPPLRTIEDSTLFTSRSIFLDRSRGELYVTLGQTRVAVYDAYADGPSPPMRLITGEDTGLNWPWGAVLTEQRELIVPNRALGPGETSVTIFAPNSDGNTTPMRTIAGPNTLLTATFRATTDRALYGGSAFAAPLEPWIFVDGFTSGDAASWSMVTP